MTKEIDAQAISAQLERIFSHPGFADAAQIQAFLRYIVEQTLAGKADHLKGYTIAVEALGRGADFDPMSDTIVRVQASKLRRLLEHYYLTDGREDPLRITLAKGTYAPEFELRQIPASEPEAKPAGAESLPAGCSIAVLPFNNLSGDPADGQFADGLVEEIITRLACFKELRVIARNSTFQYKDKAVDVRQVGRDLGATQVLEGSVRRAGETLRIALQLLDAATGAHLWAESLDYRPAGQAMLDIQEQAAARVCQEVAWLAGLQAEPYHLDEAEKSEDSAVEAAEPERRQLTVMACQLERPESSRNHTEADELFEAVRGYHQTFTPIIERFGGTIEKRLGNSLVVYFGYPNAHEDDAERAVRAGLSVLTAAASAEAGVDAALQTHIGIATGRVVVGPLEADGGSGQRAAVGQVLNAVAQLQALAEPGSVVIGSLTRRLTEGVFDYRELGSEPQREGADQIQAWRVIGVLAKESRFEARAVPELAPLVGRKTELALLIDRWRQAQEGDGQVVFLSGEPGIGKSRIVQQLREHVANFSHTRLRYQCSPYHGNSALYPIIAQLRRAAEFSASDQPATKLDKLEHLLAESGASDARTGFLLAALLDLPAEQRYAPLELEPQRQKALTLTILVERMQAVAAQKPLLVIFEDAHWSDPTTLELLERVVDHIQHAPIFLVLTFRPEFTPPWSDYPHTTALTLNRLSRQQSRELIDRQTAGKRLPEAVYAQLEAKIDGVPLFVEELTRTVLESGLLTEGEDRYHLNGPLPPLAIPSTLQDSLMARLDRLGPVKETAQIGAVIGREFSYALVASLARVKKIQLEDSLNQLVESGLLFRRGAPPDASYTFKHALVQDTAYDSMLRSKRQQWHARVARALQDGFPETAESQPEVLARHYTEAGLSDQAIGFWEQAGQRALAVSANQEAKQYFRRALALLHDLPSGPATMNQEIALQMGLAGVLITTDGFAAAATQEAFDRAHALCKQAGDAPQLLAALMGIADAQFVRGQLDESLDICTRAFKLAEKSGDSDYLVHIQRMLGILWFFKGNGQEARRYLEQCLSLYDQKKHADIRMMHGLDPAVDACVTLAINYWLCGAPDEALKLIEQGEQLARKLSHAFSLAQWTAYAAFLHALRGDLAAGATYADECVVIASEHGFPVLTGAGMVFSGWTLAHRGDLAEGIARLREGIETYRETDAKVFLSVLFALLAEAQTINADYDDALKTLEQALALVQKIDERFFEPELHRLKGNALQQQGKSVEEVEPHYLTAIETAKERGFKSLELRTATSLSRLWQAHGDSKKAHALLSDIYTQFSEGFDTADLQDAKALLAELDEASS